VFTARYELSVYVLSDVLLYASLKEQDTCLVTNEGTVLSFLLATLLRQSLSRFFPCLPKFKVTKPSRFKFMNINPLNVKADQTLVYILALISEFCGPYLE
jgi:hypothetical protein